MPESMEFTNAENQFWTAACRPRIVEIHQGSIIRQPLFRTERRKSSLKYTLMMMFFFFFYSFHYEQSLACVQLHVYCFWRVKSWLADRLVYKRCVTYLQICFISINDSVPPQV